MSWWARWRPAGRLTNLALLGVLVGAFVTGFGVFAAGRAPAATVATVAHGALGLAVIALLPWKSMIIMRSGARRPVGVLLGGAVALCLVAGLVQMVGGYGYLAGVSPIQVHVGAALVMLALLVWHVLRHRRQRVRRTDLSRRNLLRTSVVATAAATGFAVLAGVAEWSRGPDRRRTVTGSRPLAPEAIPATIWLFDDVPVIEAGGHRVRVDGTDLSVAELAARSLPVPARLDCTSGWYADATWTGVSVADLVPPAAPPPDALPPAQSIIVRSVTGYVRRFPIGEAADLWLATGVEGRPLTPGTGAPVRLVAPGRRGFWWVKWVASVELSEQPAWRQLPFPPS